mgnify:FL=1
MKSKFSSFLHKTWFQSAKRKGFTLMEILVACAIIIALSVGAFFAYQQAQQTRKMAQMNQDMEAIANAALSYEAMSTDSTLPDSIATMITGLSADKSIDGSEHKLLTQFKGGAEATDVTDPWGANYTYSPTDRTITCTPKDASGTAMATVTRHF